MELRHVSELIYAVLTLCESENEIRFFFFNAYLHGGAILSRVVSGGGIADATNRAGRGRFRVLRSEELLQDRESDGQ